MPIKEIIETYKKNRISLHDTNDNIVIRENPEHDQYMWVPAELEKHLVSYIFHFFSSFFISLKSIQ